MSRLLVRRMIVLLLAVFVTAGMDLSAVQANAISLKMMDMAPGMDTSGNGKCDDSKMVPMRTVNGLRH